MRSLPSNVLSICEEAAEKHPVVIDAKQTAWEADVKEAVDEAERRVHELPEFDEIVSMLVHDALEHAVCDFRHQAARKKKLYKPQPQKVFLTSSPGVRRVLRAWLDRQAGGAFPEKPAKRRRKGKKNCDEAASQDNG